MSGFLQNNVRDPRSQDPDFLELCALAKLVRTAKSKDEISKFFVDQNGRIKVKKSSDDKEYTEVKSEADLQSLL